MVQFKYGSQAAYNSLESKEAQALYFISDSQRIYRGETLLAANNVKFVSSLPAVGSAYSGILYVTTSDSGITLSILNSEGTEFVTVASSSTSVVTPDGAETLTNKTIDASKNTITNLDVADFANDAIVTAISTDSPVDTKLVSEKAVADYVATVKTAIEESITTQIGEVDTKVDGVDERVTSLEADDPIVDVSAARAEDNSGTVITFTTKKNQTKEVTVADFFLTSASYDADTHILSLTVKGSPTPVEVNLEDLIPDAVSTSDVGLSSNIVTTIAVGNIAKGTTLNKDMDLQSLLLKMLSKDSLPTATQPSVSVSNASMFRTYEVGTVLSSLTATGSFSAGSYSQTAANDQVASGVTTVADSSGHVWTATCTGQTTKYLDTVGATTGAFTFDGITVEDATDVVITVKANHSAGNTPKSYLGNTEVDGVATSTKAIAAGTKSASTAHIKGFRYGWYGYKTSTTAVDSPEVLTSSQIKALGNQSTSLPSSLNTNGMQQMFFAFPHSLVGTKTLSIASNSTSLPQTVKGPYTVQVGGVNDHSPIAYDVFYVSNASADAGSDKYNLTWN